MTIPVSNIVSINPNVISSGGNALAMNGLILSASQYIPSGTVPSFNSAQSVANYFGAASIEYAMAQNYFLANDTSTMKPAALLFANANLHDRVGWVQSGSMASMTLTQLQALSGVLTVNFAGVATTSSNINLATATSFTNAATMIQAAFTSPNFTVSFDPIKSAFIFTTTSGGSTQTVAPITGTLAAGLYLTAQTGAVISQGVPAQDFISIMNGVVSITQNWVSFSYVDDLSSISPAYALTSKTNLAQWTNAQNQRYAFITWDTDVSATVQGSTTCFGYVTTQAEYDGVVPIYNNYQTAAFIMGWIAAMDFSRLNGRSTAAFKTQAGLLPTVTDSQTASNLLGNGYSFYGNYATPNQQENFFYNGQMSGRWEWLDTFVSQVYMNSQFQLALITLLTNVGSVPYNQQGYSLIRAAMQDPINQALNYGGIKAGVSLSQLQIAEVNQAAGLDVASTIQTQGYYLQILDPGAQVRGNRGTPVINFWYTDGGAVQMINVASVDIM